jgi:hypothetical protein
LSNCRTGCKTQDHANWGECARAANLSVSNEQVSNTLKKNEKELTAYRDARKLGIQPASTRMKDIQKAVRVSEATGRAAKA